MRISLVALTGLLAIGGNLGVLARALPNDQALASINRAQEVTEYADEEYKRGAQRLVARDTLLRLPSWGKPSRPETKPAPVPGKPAPAPVTAPKPNVPAPGKPDTPDGKPVIPTKPGKPDKPDVPGKPKVCKPKKPKKSIRKRAYTKADASDPAKVLQWLKESEGALGVSPEKTVFYATGYNGEGEDMAYQFTKKNPDYAWWETVFYSKKFRDDFGVPDPKTGDPGAATSKAFAQWSRNALVFNHDDATPSSYWLTHELPYMQNAKISQMKDNALSPTEIVGPLTTSSKPNPQDC